MTSRDIDRDVSTPVAVLSKLLESARACAKASGLVMAPLPTGVFEDFGVDFFEVSFDPDFAAFAACLLSFDA